MRATATTTIRLSPASKRRLSRAARERGLSLSSYLVMSAEEAANKPPMSGLARELEKLAIDGMAMMALDSIRKRAAKNNLDTLTDEQIIAVVKDTRRQRRNAR